MAEPEVNGKGGGKKEVERKEREEEEGGKTEREELKWAKGAVGPSWAGATTPH